MRPLYQGLMAVVLPAAWPASGDDIIGISVSISPPAMRIEFETTPGQGYSIEYADDLTAGEFGWSQFNSLDPGVGTMVETGAVPGALTFTDSFTEETSGAQPDSGSRTYRVRTGTNSPAKIALYADPLYVDTVPTNIVDAEAANLLALLQDEGHTVVPFGGTNESAFTMGLASAEILVMPELEAGDLAGDLDPAAFTVLSNFVSGGGCLILHGTSGSRDEDLLNQAFGYEIAETGTEIPGTMALQTPEASNSVFVSGPATIDANDTTVSWDAASLPGSAVSAYEFDVGHTVVVTIKHGQGTIFLLGWDWFDGVPVGSEDGGWLAIYRLALEGCDCCPTGDVGYYNISLEDADPAYVAPIEAAGLTARAISIPDSTSLSDLDVLFANNPATGLGTEYRGLIGDISAAVQKGMVLIVHDREITRADELLPGSTNLVAVLRLSAGNDIDVVDDTTLVTDGPAGMISDNSLDNGFLSSFGYVDDEPLPAGGAGILSRAEPTHFVTVVYPFGQGWVIYSTIDLDVQIKSGGNASFRDKYAPNVIAYGAELAAGAP